VHATGGWGRRLSKTAAGNIEEVVHAKGESMAASLMYGALSKSGAGLLEPLRRHVFEELKGVRHYHDRLVVVNDICVDHKKCSQMVVDNDPACDRGVAL